jgi:hypothetical protein
MMDTSTEYLKMCDCPEIQDFRKEYGQWQDGDFAADKAAPRDISFHCSECDHEYGAEFQLDCIWLPRQDQLQEMVDWKDMRLIIEWRSVTHRFEWWADNPFSITALDYRAKVESLEQAWLHLVMYRKYGKRWSGKGWVDAAP